MIYLIFARIIIYYQSGGMCGGLLKNIFSVKYLDGGADWKYLPTIFVCANDTMGCRISRFVTNIHVNPDNTSSDSPLPTCYCHIQMQMGHLMKNTWGESCYMLQRSAWGGNNVTSPGATPADSFIWKHLDDAASTDNLHNCSHCLNHCDHQQASLDISLSGFHHPR